MPAKTSVQYVEFGNGEAHGCVLRLPKGTVCRTTRKVEPGDEVVEFSASFRLPAGTNVFGDVEKLSG